MLKKGIRHIVSLKCTIIFGFLVLVTVAIYNYTIRPHCYYERCNFTQKNSLTQLQTENKETKYASISSASITNISSKLSKVNVKVNYRENFVGLKVNNELYVPFNFLKNYYEVDGNFVTDESNEEDEVNKPESFIWLHTSKNNLDPRNLKHTVYSPFGMYLNFKDSDVANRARVKCICGKYEVPITTQWDPKGYYYPTQIAQYGLSHFCKHLGEHTPQKEWKLKIKKGLSGRFSTYLNIKDLKIVKVKLLKKLTSFSIKVLATDQNKYILHYTDENSAITRTDKTIVHGLGNRLEKTEIVRDLNVDLVKGLSFREGKRQGSTVSIYIRKIYEIMFLNIEYVVGVKFTNVDHVSMFLAAANWFIDFQDAGGGWKTNVSRVVFKGMKREAGWYSSMGQGQALSLLSRVYKFTGKRKYLNAALKSTDIFNVPSNKDGVLAMLFGKYPWYEEYPTTPSLYVLNGFIYSLFGLHDLSKVASEYDGKEARRLFQQGVSSLETLLPLFDNGHGSFYDLRHISVPGHPPNRARWQYHRVHLEQLFAIVDITKSIVVNKTLTRWIQYASGVTAKHN